RRRKASPGRTVAEVPGVTERHVLVGVRRCASVKGDRALGLIRATRPRDRRLIARTHAAARIGKRCPRHGNELPTVAGIGQCELDYTIVTASHHAVDPNRTVWPIRLLASGPDDKLHDAAQRVDVPRGILRREPFVVVAVAI